MTRPMRPFRPSAGCSSSPSGRTGAASSRTSEGLTALRAEPAACEDLRSVVGVGLQGAGRLTSPLQGELSARALRVHARYTREELVAALDYVSIDGRKPNSFREGVLFASEARATRSW